LLVRVLPAPPPSFQHIDFIISFLAVGWGGLEMMGAWVAVGFRLGGAFAAKRGLEQVKESLINRPERGKL
jgi:hypothetical protein